MCLSIKDGALFISDAHENDNRNTLYRFLKKVKSKEIVASQLFLMGDMFDLLVGEVKYLREKSREYIDMIEEIAKDIEVYYFEGNHDFALQRLFENCKVIPIEEQPKIFKISNKKILLSHGDRYGGVLHTVYTKVIRNRVLLKTLDLFDRICNSYISKMIIRSQLNKDICLKIEDFLEIVERKISENMTQDADMIAEGHYHQGVAFDCEGYKYINFSSFACNQSYFIVQLSPDIEFKEIKLRGYDV